ncbi:MAG: hypothetical protein HWE21_05130 [Cytophagia bacterium]|nr:hypothetical protein [Cytophagia bacterium]NVK83680.1 hypothetical protein [Cytophagia bacterium]
MIRKISTFSLCMVALLLAGHSALAQEEGGGEGKPHEEIIVLKDSSIIYESGEGEQILQPVATPFNIPVKENQKKNGIIPTQENSLIKPTQENQVKPKETKQDFSFNIIYYLIYKFKQVDN